MTDTALYADVVLPATTFLEGYDFAKAYGPINLDLGAPGHRRRRRSALERRRVRRAVHPARSARRGRAVGRARPARRGARRAAGHDRRRPARRRAAGAAVWLGADSVRRRVSRTRRIARSICFRPRSKRTRRSASIAYQPDPATDRYPLALISPASERTISSTLGELPRPDVKLTMHPDDAAARGLADNDLVRVFNDLGEVHCTLNVAAAIRPARSACRRACGGAARETASPARRSCPIR